MTAAEQLMQEYVDNEQMAKLLKISLGTLENRICKGSDHPPFIGRGRSRQFPLDEYRKWAKSQLIHQKNRVR